MYYVIDATARCGDAVCGWLYYTEADTIEEARQKVKDEAPKKGGFMPVFGGKREGMFMCENHYNLDTLRPANKEQEESIQEQEQRREVVG